MTEEKWNRPQYQRIVSVKTEAKDLVVEFLDKSKVKLPRESILPPNVNNPDWTSIQHDPYEIVIPTPSGNVEISWSTIRLLSDPEYASYWALMAEEQAKDIGRRLRSIRMSRNLTSKIVAERAGISPQSLSRIEKGYHDVVFTTLNKILAAMGCTLQDLANARPEPLKLTSLFRKLEAAGIRKDWLIDRILPPEVIHKLDREKSGEQELLNFIASYISRVFSCSVDNILKPSALSLDASLIQAAKFKAPSRVQQKYATAYALYAHYLALLVLHATEHINTQPLPDDPHIVRNEIENSYGPLNFENALRYIWDHGVPVIPLSDPGTFHGACWKVSDRSVIVLKQITKYQGRWLHDLLHETGHVKKHLSIDNSAGGIVEGEEISPFEDDAEEQEASDFAAGILFTGRAEELAEMCVGVAKNSVERLKSAVIQVAANEHIPVDLLANYIAFRLSKTNHINWWGTANNLQVTDPSPWLIAKETLLSRIATDRLNPEDYNLLMRAVEE